MYFLYNVLLGLGFAILLPKFLLDAYRHRKYVTGLPERLGFIEKLNSKDRPVLWLHCVSVGETQAAQPLVQAISREFSQYRIVVSTVTITGQKLAREVFKNQAERIFYLPLDWRWTVRRTLRAIAPSVVLIMETELWPGFLRECRRQQIPVAIVNGRLSERSFRRYRLVSSFISQVVNCLKLAIMQTESDARRMGDLGLGLDRVFVSGNIKFDAGVPQAQNQLIEELTARYGLRSANVMLAASTHDPEERIILECFQELLKRHSSKSKLIIAPRHPERFAEVADLLDASGLRWLRRTAQPGPNDAACQILLLDTIGELRSIFPVASVVFVGGSIAKVGGHNVLEPAAVGACIVTGPHTENFRDIMATFVQADALVQLAPLSDQEAVTKVTEVLEELLRDPERRQALGERARNLVFENRGATERTLEILSTVLTGKPLVPAVPNGFVTHERVESA
jgi:3-deoxy-D-manno-octulosonic-acid transferase